MKQVEYKGKNYQIPESADELTPEQYYRCLEIYTLMVNHKLQAGAVRLKLLTLFLSLPVDASLLRQPELSELIPLLDITYPFIEWEGDFFRMKIASGTNLLPQWEGFTGPKDMMNDVSFEAFCTCMALIRKIMDQSCSANHSMQDLGRLLYSNGKGSTPPDIICLHACIFASKVIRIIRTEPVDIDGELIDFRILFKSSRRATFDDHLGWTGIAMDVAESGVFGNYQDVLGRPFWDVLIYLYKKKFEHLHRRKE